MTHHVFSGNRRLFLSAAPYIALVVVLKAIAHLVDFEPLDLSPLLAGAIGAEVFIVGFLLTGTAGDFKEAERLPGELASSMENIADELLILHQYHPAEARGALAQLVALGRSMQEFLLQNLPFDHALSQLRGLNPFLMFFAANGVNSTFVGRMKNEQAAIRRVTLRMDTMRRTSYVSAGFLIAESIAVVLAVASVLTDLGALAPTLVLVGVLAALLICLLFLIRDLDNPFEYHDGRPGAADVSPEVLELTLLRIQGAYDELVQDGAAQTATERIAATAEESAITA